jgi:membrane-associated phospholipid phosphatase
MVGILAVIFAFDVIGARIVHIGGTVYMSTFLVLAALIPVCCCPWSRFARLTELGALLIWAILGDGAVGLLAHIAGRSASPLVDGQLGQWDLRLGVSTSAAFFWVSHHPALRWCLNFSYGLLTPLIIAAIAISLFWGSFGDSHRLILRAIVAGVITAALFAMWPAAGPWVSGGFAPSEDQRAVESCLHSLKSVGLVDFSKAKGVVSFPSFHVVLALLSALALRRVKYVRWLAGVLALLICISTVTTGWHYFADVIGGVLVTMMAAWLTAAILPNRILQS